MALRKKLATVGSLGEFPLIARIERRASKLAAPGWTLRIGDDAAVFRPRRGEELVVSTDAVVESVHFHFGRESARSIGRRALVANLSDLAAMGARPVGFTLALATPPTLPVARADGILSGLLAEAERFGCPLVGGNVTRAKECSLGITIFGIVRNGTALRRSGVRPRDRLFVTGELGRSALARAKADHSGKPGALRYVPTPRVEAGRALARMNGVGGCIDISDGLVGDLRHLTAASGCGAEIDAERVPRPSDLLRTAARVGADPTALLFAGGEDYELLFSLRPDAAPLGPRGTRRLTERLGVMVTEIGSATRMRGLRGVPDLAGHRHF